MTTKKLLAIGIALFFATTLAAQTFRGAIQGIVIDTAGALVADADVTVTSAETGLKRTTVTHDFGEYSATELPLGVYDGTVTKTGFRTPTMKGISVRVSSPQPTAIHL